MRGAVAMLVLWAASCGIAAGQVEYRPSDALREEHSLRIPELPGKSNAAHAYFKAWDAAGKRGINEVDSVSSELPAKGARLTPKQREALRNQASYIDSIIAVADNPVCNWGVDKSAGWDMGLPHLGRLRQSARALALDAVRCREDKNYIAAVVRVRAILQMSVHAAEEPVLISTLVGAAIGLQAVRTADMMLDDKELNPATAKQMLQAFRAVPRADFYNARKALDAEREATTTWMLAKCDGADAGIKLIKMLRAPPSPYDIFDPYFRLLRMNEQQMQAETARADLFYKSILGAWGRPDGGAALEELELELREGQWGVVANVMAPSVLMIRRRLLKAQADFDRVEHQLQSIAEPVEAVGSK